MLSKTFILFVLVTFAIAAFGSDAERENNPQSNTNNGGSIHQNHDKPVADGDSYQIQGNGVDADQRSRLLIRERNEDRTGSGQSQSGGVGNEANYGPQPIPSTHRDRDIKNAAEGTSTTARKNPASYNKSPQNPSNNQPNA